MGEREGGREGGGEGGFVESKLAYRHEPIHPNGIHSPVLVCQNNAHQVICHTTEEQTDTRINPSHTPQLMN